MRKRTIYKRNRAIFRKARMATDPLRWPNNQKKYRDQAAERVNRAAKKLDVLMDGRARKEEDVLVVAVNAQKDLFAALRWLERAGAGTLPDEL